MAQYKKCQCGDNLDYDEKCDCLNKNMSRGLTAYAREIARMPGAVIVGEKRPGERNITWKVASGNV